MALPPALAQKMGPLPVWGWGLAGGGVLVFVVVKEKHATATPAAAPIIMPAGGGNDVGGGSSGGGGGATDPGSVQTFDLAGILAGLNGQSATISGGGETATVTPSPEPVQNPADVGSILASMRGALAGLTGTLGITLPGGATFNESVTGNTPFEPPVILPTPPPPPPSPIAVPPTGQTGGGFLFNLPAVYRQTSNFLNQWGFAGNALSGGRPAMQGLSAGAVLGDLGGLVLPVAYQPNKDTRQVGSFSTGAGFSGASTVLTRTYDIAAQNGQLGNQAYVQAILKTQLSRLKQDAINNHWDLNSLGWDLSNVPAYYATSYAPGQVDLRW